MPEMNEYAAGIPCWVDLATTDPADARRFYGGLFGWEFDIGGEDVGGYTNARIGEHVVAGLAGEPISTPGLSPQWTTYLASIDAETTAAAVSEHGGTVLMGPMAVHAFGTMVIAIDPTGAMVGVWQGGTHVGATLVNEPGCVLWNDLVTPDVGAASAFYGAVWPFGFETMGEGETRYDVLNVDGRMVGGIGTGDGPPRWRTYFAVADADASVATAIELGATLVSEVTDTPYGRTAVITDPQGAELLLICPPSES